MRRFSSLLGAAAIVGLVACGGGGDDDDPPADPVTPPTPVTFAPGPVTDIPVLTLYTPPHALKDTELCDHDADGTQDLAWMFSTTYNDDPTHDIESMPGVGDGSFLSEYGGGGYASVVLPEIVAGRFLGTGVEDEGYALATENPDGSIFVRTVGYRFVGMSRIQVGGAGGATGSPAGLVAGDWNGDGTEDLAVGDSDASRVLSWLSLGETGLEDDVETALPGATVPTTLAAGDVDGDGDDDIVVALGGDGYVVLASLGDGTFSAGSAVPLGSGRSFASMVCGDVDGDGDEDVAGVVLQSAQPRRLGTLRGNDDGTFGSLVLTTLETSLGATPLLHLHVGDFNGDLRDDLAFVAPALDRTVVMLGDGVGRFVDAPDADLLGGGNATLGKGDVDGDGDLDLVVGDETGMSVRALLNETF